MCKEYNGWSNYQTWNVMLWLDDDQELCTYIREKAEEIQRMYEDNEFEHMVDKSIKRDIIVAKKKVI